MLEVVSTFITIASLVAFVMLTVGVVVTEAKSAKAAVTMIVYLLLGVANLLVFLAQINVIIFTAAT